MDDIPFRTRVSTLVLAFATLIAFYFAWLWLDQPWSRQNFVALVLLFAMILISELFDVSVPQAGTTFHVSVSAAFALAAGLTIGPFLGGLVVVGAHLVDGVYVRRQPIKIAVNASLLGLSTLTSAVVYLNLANLSESPLASYRNIAAVVAAAAVYTLLNSGALAFIVAPVVGVSTFEMWRANFGGLSREMITLVTLGSLIPVLVRENPFSLILLIVPLFIGPHHAFAGLRRAHEETRATMESLVDALEQRDPYTHRHSIRVVAHVQAVLEEMDHLPGATREAILAAARVHDLGKVGTKDATLQKPGALTPEERRGIQQHAAVGADIVGRLDEYKLGADSIRHHHERWDGTGYPDGLRGEEIPLGARIIGIVDAFDAMTSDRVYRPAMEPEVALSELRKDSGSHFDPHLVQIFEQAIRRAPLQSTNSPADGTHGPLIQSVDGQDPRIGADSARL